MLSLVLDRSDPSSFTSLVNILQGSIRNQVSTFTLDPMLGRVEDSDSLYNLALVKVHLAVDNFKYDSLLTKEHNERKFLAMVKKYIRNEMIDRQYAANVDKRKPNSAIVSITNAVDSDSDASYGNPCDYDIPSADPSVLEKLEAQELDDFMRQEFRLDSEDNEEARVYGLLSTQHPPERIAGKLGMPVSRVRYIIYERIQPYARRYV